MAIKAVLFDLDGTLWNLVHVANWDAITAAQVAALRPHFERFEIAADPTDFVPHFWEDLHNTLWPPSTDLREPRWDGVLQRTLARFRAACSPTAGEAIIEELMATPLELFGIAAFADAAPALTGLHHAGIKLGLVTNNNKHGKVIARHLLDRGLPDVFGSIVTSVDIGFRKPHATPFQAALDQLGVTASESAHVGDSYENDVAPALALGMTAIFRANGEVTSSPTINPHFKIRTLHELPAIIGLTPNA